MTLLEPSEGSTELKRVIQIVSRDKNLDKAVIVDALEQAVLHAARRKLGLLADLEAHYNDELDEVEVFQFRTVVNDTSHLENAEVEITLEEAKKLDTETEIGDSLGVKIDAGQFGRIAAQSAKQIIIQKVRDAEKAQVHEEFKDRVGEILSGNIRRFERNDIIVDLGRTEAVIPNREQISSERFKLKDRVQGYVVDVKRASRGPQIIMSRAHQGFLIRLFEQVVTEIDDGIVTIESAARDAGQRSKIAVHSKDSSVDPVGACVGIKGARVQAVVQELNGEKIDIVTWDSDPAKFVCNALAPAMVNKVIVDEVNRSMEVIVAEDQLSLAIGKRGQNVRLAAQLTGWRLDIKSESKLEVQLSGARNLVAQIEGIGAIRAEILVNEGVKTPAEIAELNPRTLVRLLNLELDEAERAIESAKNFKEKADAGEGQPEEVDAETAELLANAVAEPDTGEQKVAEDHKRLEKVEVFKKLSGVGEAAAFALADAGYVTIGDIVADSAEEVASKTGLALGTARTVQIAADKHLQNDLAENQKEDDD